MEIGTKSGKLGAHQAVAVSIGSCGKAVGNTRINTWVIPRVGSNQLVEDCAAHDFGQVVFVGNLLEQCTDNLPGFLKQPLIIPEGIDLLQLTGNSVVLTEPQSVHYGEGNLLVGSYVTCKEAALCIQAGHDVILVNWKSWFLSWQCWPPLLQKSFFKKPDCIRNYLI